MLRDEGLHHRHALGVVQDEHLHVPHWPGVDEDAPTGRPAGSIAWAGLANLYYWIDRRTGVAGYWGTQILPFVDAASVGGYLEMETAVYDALRG